MANKTPIQWCDSTVNPVMGCDGCELWPTPAKLKIHLVDKLKGTFPLVEGIRLIDVVARTLGDMTLSDIWKRRKAIAQSILEELEKNAEGTIKLKKKYEEILKIIAELFKCYAGRLHLMRGGRKGYAPTFEVVTQFSGRTTSIARASDLSGLSRPEKPWLDGLPRTIFVSDMGDALSNGVSYPYLHQEIIAPACSEEGSRHIWFWLTKRPHQMASFSRFLIDQKIHWPDNLVPMTSVTSASTLKRVEQLKQVKARFKGLSVEPLWGPVTPDLKGIDWCIVGGESGPSAKPFDLAWPRALRDRCPMTETAFFMKQLGASPVEGMKPLLLEDGHGGDWSEWPDDLKIRTFPRGFYGLGNGSLIEKAWPEMPQADPANI